MPITPSRTKFIYITGCDSGFGSIVTRKLDKAGFGVIAGVYLESSIDQIKADCSEFVFPIRVDVSDEASVEQGAAKITEIVENAKGVLHGIINNAGILVQPAPSEWTSNEAYRRMFNVNIMGTVMTTKSLLPLLRKSQGRIVNVASIAGRIGLPTAPAYCMSKFGVEGYSEVLRKDMYAWGITVHIIEPGIFNQTGLYDNYYSGADEVWANLPSELRESYGEAFFKAFKAGMKTGKDAGSPNSHLVPEAMVEAITSLKPKYRYKIGNDSKFVVPLFEKLHESVQDGLLGPAWRKLKAKPNAAPENGVEIAYQRYEKNWPRFIAACLVAGWIGKRAFLSKM